MANWKIEVEGTEAVAAEFKIIGDRVAQGIQKDLVTTTKEFTAKWRRAAAESSGSHGRLYPLAITAEFIGPLESVIGPDSSKPQGGMNFEYGSPSVIRSANPTGGPFPRPGGGFYGGGRMGQRVGQDAPHLDGNKTADVEFPKLVTKVEATVARLI